jgi:hypothetical protein
VYQLDIYILGKRGPPCGEVSMRVEKVVEMGTKARFGEDYQRFQGESDVGRV